MGLSFESAETAREGLESKAVLNNGVEMPWLGLGVFKMESDALTTDVVKQALDKGYKRIDTAALYGNERGVGQAIRECGSPRESLFLTTKIWNDDMRADRVAAAFEESMDRLGLDYVDLLLLHWPIEGKIVQSWEALLPFYEEGRIKALGVSNFLQSHLEELKAASDVRPVINQVEYHPYLQLPELKVYCESNDIFLEAWSPFMHGGQVLADPVLTKIGAAKGKTSAQVILRWILQTGVLTIPKTVTPERLIQNSDIFDFELDAGEMSEIAALERNLRSGADPRSFDF